MDNQSHYKVKSPQAIEVIQAWGLNYLEGNIIKYLARWRFKGGIDDLKKARQYLDWLIEVEETGKIAIDK